MLEMLVERLELKLEMEMLLEELEVEPELATGVLLLLPVWDCD